MQYAFVPNGVELFKMVWGIGPILPVVLHTELICGDRVRSVDVCADNGPGFSPLLAAISKQLRIWEVLL